MPVIEVARLPKKKLDSRRLLEELCWYYPQYTLTAARHLPAKDVFSLLKTARKKEAERYFNMVQISAAPHTKKGQGIKKLSSHYKRLMNG